MSINIKPVILCGGSGTRLWPLSRESFPKQFVPLISGKSLLGLTIDRVGSLGSAICITNEEHRFFVQDLLKGSSESLDASILLEPSGRNTAAAMSCATFMPVVADSDLLLFLPSDHFVPDVEAFISTMQSGVTAAQEGYIVTFGVQPSFPSTAYGYIQQGDQLDTTSKAGNAPSSAFGVARFVEKPPIDQAQAMLLSGHYLWNAGIFLCQASVLKNALHQHAPDI